MIKQIDHINIVVSDLSAAERFFSHFGFKRKAGGRLEGAWISAVVGLPDVVAEYVALDLSGRKPAIELLRYYSPRHEATAEINKPNAIGYRHIALEVSDIEKHVEELKRQNVTLLSDIQVFPANGKKLVYFLGPDNILLELAQYQVSEPA